MDKMRQQFEDFVRNHYYFCEVDTGFSEDDQEYCDSELQNAWEIWQASRAYVSVRNPGWDFDTGYSYADYILGELEDSGVLVGGIS
jgi:hypothetical protein